MAGSSVINFPGADGTSVIGIIAAIIAIIQTSASKLG